jgi:hypothetical protein
MKVRARARSRPDRGGDPLDGLVNLFDLGIVLSVAFLLAALSSVNLSKVLTQEGRDAVKEQSVVVPLDDATDLPQRGPEVRGRGTQVGTVYRLEDGRTVFVPGR